MNSYDIAGSVIFITGAAGQLGQAIVTSCLKAGAKLICLDISRDDLEVAAKKNDWVENVLLHAADITDEDCVEEAFNIAIQRFGRIDALVNNAGVSVFDSWDQRTEIEFDWVTNVNLKGTFFCMKAYLKYLQSSQTAGTVVNVASVYGVVSPDPRIYTDLNRRNSEIYGATKAGVIQMSKYFATNGIIDGARVRVNAVAPGGIRNPIDPQGEDFQRLYSERCALQRMAEVEEIVAPILFLISPDSSYINGHVLVADGGMTAW